MSKLKYLAVGAFIAVAGAAIIANSMNSKQMPGHVMTTPDLTGIADGDAIMQVALPAEFSSQAQMGERAFNAVCASCHGQNAAGTNGLAPPLVHIFYESTHHGDAAFVSAVQNGVRAHHWTFGDMVPVKGLTNADIGNITAYVRELQRANGIN